MRLFLLTASLIATLGLTSCADHVSRIATADPTPQDPIGPGDGSTVGGGGGSGSGGGTLPSGGDGQTGGGTGGTGGTGGPTSGGSSTDGGKEGGQGGNGPGGSPVPEPGTMLLVGTGLAGAAFMRRRRKNGEAPAQA